jgi:hypothetical protein
MGIGVICFVLALAAAVAQPSPTPSPSASLAPSRSISLRFALPPMPGTISLGIYDREGKLLRVLHREDTVSEFTAGHDALETSWDGNDDSGRPLPNGKYSARGYVVGDLKVEGMDYLFNDWVTDEQSPHVRSLGQLLFAIRRRAAFKARRLPFPAAIAATGKASLTSFTRSIARPAKTRPPGSSIRSAASDRARSSRSRKTTNSSGDCNTGPMIRSRARSKSLRPRKRFS